MSDVPASIAELAARAETGEAAAKDALFEALYGELHRLAQSHLYRSGGPITLGATTLLHEAYLSLAQRDGLSFPDRNRFLGYASRAMRGLIIGYVRNRTALKRGGELTFASMDAVPEPAAAETPEELDALDRALDGLAAVDPGLAELVDLKFFCGFSIPEIAALRATSERTVQRDWAKARMLLHASLLGD
jgi:RNA polymerase sigma factor (TIGR02999 family)